MCCCGVVCDGIWNLRHLFPLQIQNLNLWRRIYSLHLENKTKKDAVQLLEWTEKKTRNAPTIFESDAKAPVSRVRRIEITVNFSASMVRILRCGEWWVSNPALRYSKFECFYSVWFLVVESCGTHRSILSIDVEFCRIVCWPSISTTFCVFSSNSANNKGKRNENRNDENHKSRLSI